MYSRCELDISGKSSKLFTKYQFACLPCQLVQQSNGISSCPFKSSSILLFPSKALENLRNRLLWCQTSPEIPREYINLTVISRVAQFQTLSWPRGISLPFKVNMMCSRSKSFPDISKGSSLEQQDFQERCMRFQGVICPSVLSP